MNSRRHHRPPWNRVATAALSAGLLGLITQGAAAQAAQTPLTPAHVLTLDSVAWTGGKGLSSSVIEGDPSVPGQTYSLLLRLQNGRWIPPHWHPRDKRVVVLSGVLLMGMGDAIDSIHPLVVPAGSVVTVPAQEHHYEGARGETILLLYGMGPLTTTYIKPVAVPPNKP